MEENEEEMTPVEMSKKLKNSMREAHFQALEMVSLFSFSDVSSMNESAFSTSENKEMIAGALLSHFRYMFEYVGDMQGLPPEEVFRGYSYFFYGNILPEMESMFKKIDDEMKGEDNE